MLAVGRSRLAAGNGLSLPKLSAVVARAIARSGPLSSGAANALTSQAAFTPFLKANLPLLANLVLREYATAAKKKTVTTKTTTVTKAAPKKKKATTTKKKPAPKRRAVAKKSGTRRTSAKKKKPAAKKKKAAPKKKPVKKKVAAKKPGIKAQFEKSLSDAPSKRASAYNVFYTDAVKSLDKGVRIAEKAKEIGAQWRALTDAQKKVWTDRAAEETNQKKAAYAQWLAKQNPLDIQAANNARNRIRAHRLKNNIKGTTSHVKIKDDRLVKRPVSSWIFFVKEKFHTPEAETPTGKDKMKKLAELWKAVPEADKKKYEDLAAKDLSRYEADKAAFLKKYGN